MLQARREKVNKRVSAKPCQGRDSDGAGVLRIPDPSVLEELKNSWASEEQEEPDWKEKEPEGEMEEQEEKEKLEQEPHNLLPEPKKEEPESEKGPDGKVIEEQEERRRSH
jgi:hypothetical protein